MDKLEGLELRKAALEAAGWTVHRRSVSDWDQHQQRYCSIAGYDTLYSVAFGEEPEFDGNRLSAWYGDSLEAWRAAPAVESSVDEALTWLTLGEGCSLDLTLTPRITDEKDSWLVEIVNHRTRQRYQAWHHIPAVAMCRAYLQHKAGA